jgi:TfoX/Sxy family transcriptional regulator of competence genes
MYLRAMAYDEALAERIRDAISVREGVSEKKMFGGIAWMLHGNMAVGITRDDLMVRVEKEEMDQVLADPAARPAVMGTKTMGGFVLVGADALTTDADLARWVDFAADYASSLPPK